MRFIYLAMLCGVSGMTLKAPAQRGVLAPPFPSVESYRLEVTCNKTSNLLFPEAIASVDRGSTAILVQKAEGVDNILRVKAGSKGFEETNLTVITREGKLYSFLVCYAASPAYLNLTVGPESSIGKPGLAYAGQPPRERMGQMAAKVLLLPPALYTLGDRRAGMQVGLKGFYVGGDVLFCRLQLQNTSTIDFEVEHVRFYLCDQKVPQRTAVQQREVAVLHVEGDTTRIRAGGRQTLVVALPRFTLPKGKVLRVEVLERSGGRHVGLKVKGRHILSAAALSD